MFDENRRKIFLEVLDIQNLKVLPTHSKPLPTPSKPLLTPSGGVLTPSKPLDLSVFYLVKYVFPQPPDALMLNRCGVFGLLALWF